mmetsp:Transcript_4861/g.20004  ORF Transcript_4861/g.20004 Transcript_4861/m.20004 type:complete len:365 (+) Transcript_4861:58-1152(+)
MLIQNLAVVPCGEEKGDVHHIMPLYYNRSAFFRAFALPIVKPNSHSFAFFNFDRDGGGGIRLRKSYPVEENSKGHCWRKHRLIGTLRVALAFPGFSRVTVRIRHRDGLLRLGVARLHVLMTGVAFSHLRRRRRRPDAVVVVRGREDLGRFGVRRRGSASRDALVQLHLVRRELTLRPRVVAPVVLKHLALEPPRFARLQPDVALHPGSNLEPGHLKPDTLVLLYLHIHAPQDARDLLELRVVLEAQLLEAKQIAELGGQGGEVVVGEVDGGGALKLPDDWRDAAGEFHLLKVELAHVSARDRDTFPLHRRLGINPEPFQRGPVISQRLQHLKIVRVASDVAGLVDEYARTLPLEEQNRLRQAPE